MGAPHQEVEQGGQQQGGGAEQVGRAPAPDVGHHTSGHLEDNHAGGEERVGGEGLDFVETGVEQEEGVDAPDERGGQGGQQRERHIDALHPGRLISHTRNTIDRR